MPCRNVINIINNNNNNNNNNELGRGTRNKYCSYSSRGGRCLVLILSNAK
jgi:hypothetical protein